mmetsp:Transcript_22682/g.39150  ORF Transcript_22682/g.39150 Transcript_22682/m.39150 type:complete len:179 (-) Transcript_22682:15-551(-)|eukprot:CAMPEP_0184693804 /NCGR_PEP_ID=MMETSP0313-20130426/1959_1 /TAXON_ID=2792 /ORGANISM="Porphyridium aerugineum, Strain SAG 1380-2" /LENGTH=178 /DNA_ID=CAMNT_0027151975 /DNA_START=77 /DNA_END=613 /DNA_ORIENTATION=-
MAAFIAACSPTAWANTASVSKSLNRYSAHHAVVPRRLGGVVPKYNKTSCLPRMQASSSDESGENEPKKKGGLRNVDVILLGAGAVGGMFALYYVLVALGVQQEKAGNIVGGVIAVGSVLLWTGTYVFRVANKDMTYAQQLRDYENAVLRKRYEELTEDELEALAAEIEDEKMSRKGGK